MTVVAEAMAEFGGGTMMGLRGIRRESRFCGIIEQYTAPGDRRWREDGPLQTLGEPVIHLLNQPATSAQIEEMMQEYEGMIKIVVDVRRRVLSGGGEMHADCESVLLEDGSEQDDFWGVESVTREILGV